MTQKTTPSIEAALTGRIDALEKRIEELESANRPKRGESVSKRSTRLHRDTGDGKGEGGSKSAGTAEKVPEADENEPAVGDQFEILSVDSRAFERDPDGGRCKFSWKIVVQSHAKVPLILKTRLEFVDMDSYLVEEDSASGFRLEPGAKGKFRGYKWISDEAEYHIVGVRAHLTEDVGAETGTPSGENTVSKE